MMGTALGMALGYYCGGANPARSKDLSGRKSVSTT